VLELSVPVPVMMPVPVVMMPMPMVPAVVVPVMMVMPVHLGGELLRILHNRAGRTGIDQRDSLCTLSRRSHNEQRSKSRQAQNFRSVHINLLKIFGYSLCAVSPISAATHSNAKASDVNVD
jgi:hypothetical protein